MRCLRSIRTNRTKAVHSVRSFRVILEAMTRSISLGQSGTRSALRRALAHPSNNRFPSLSTRFLRLPAGGSWSLDIYRGCKSGTAPIWIP